MIFWNHLCVLPAFVMSFWYLVYVYSALSVIFIFFADEMEGGGDDTDENGVEVANAPDVDDTMDNQVRPAK